MEGQGRPLDSSEAHPSSAKMRRMALNACETCRQRKSRCDEGRPRCGRCERLDIDCFYAEAGSKKEFVLPRIEESLLRMESKLDDVHRITSSLQLHQSGMGNENIPAELLSPLIANDNVTSPNERYMYGSKEYADFGRPASASQYAPVASVHSGEDFVLAIPFRHITAPQNILFWPCMQATPVVANVNYPVIQELARGKPLETVLPPIFLDTGHPGVPWLESITLPQIHRLVRYYFDDLHPHAPILNKSDFQHQILGTVLSSGFHSNLNTCIVLLVFAIGSLSAVDHNDTRWLDRENYEEGTSAINVGMGFFRLASEILRSKADLSWKACQAHLLAGIYQSHQMRLYEHWHAVHEASIKIMILLQKGTRLGPLESQIYWVAYLQESQILAELEFPPSGISRFEGIIPLPFNGTGNSSEPDSEYDFIFLAQIALRRLLNRIHSNIYNTVDDTIPSTGGLSPTELGFVLPMVVPSASIIQELDHQLETWRSHLPSKLMFPSIESVPGLLDENLMGPQQRSVRNKLLGFVKARYCAAKAIIFRPLVYKVLHAQDPTMISEEDRRGAALCLKAVLRGPLYAGLMSDSFRVMQVPIMPCRSMFAAAVLTKVVSMNENCISILPDNWDIVDHVRKRLELEVVPISPIVKEDMQILHRLDDLRFRLYRNVQQSLS